MKIQRTQRYNGGLGYWCILKRRFVCAFFDIHQADIIREPFALEVGNDDLKNKL